MASILESSSIKYLKQPRIDHKHSAYTTPSSPTSNLCSFNNSLKCQLPFYPDIKWTNMFSLPSMGQIPSPAAPTQGAGSLAALPATTPLWPGDTTVSFPLTHITAYAEFSSGLIALPNHLAFASVWSERVGTERSSNFLFGFLPQLEKRIRSSQERLIFEEKCHSEKYKEMP